MTRPRESQSTISRRAVLTGIASTATAAVLLRGRSHPAAADPVPSTTAPVMPPEIPDVLLAGSPTPFTAVDGYLSDAANGFWTIYGLADGPAEMNGFPDLGNINPTWDEWHSLKYAWTTDGGLRANFMSGLFSGNPVNGVDASGKQADGYVWSWIGQETWPDADGYEHHGVASYHFDQIPRYIIAVHDFYVWTHDSAFLKQNLPKAEVVMDSYLLEAMRGADGLATITWPDNDGTATSRPSTYMDQIRSGYQVTWINDAFYTALVGLAELEHTAWSMSGSAAARSRWQRYEQIADGLRSEFQKKLWNPRTSRFVTWIDADGSVHDTGATYANLEAVARGLATESQALQILDQLDSAEAAPTGGGAHKGSTYAYQNVFAPRSQLRPFQIPGPEWDQWSVPPDIADDYPYGEQVENGGTAMWWAYYDIMARLRYTGADDAFHRMRCVVDRCAYDSYYLTFDANSKPARSMNSYGEDWTEVGTNWPFPESGIAILPWIYGFLGLRASGDQLTVSPNLPSNITQLGASRIDFNTQELTVQVARAIEVTKNWPARSAVVLTSGDEVTTRLSSESFDEIGLYLGSTSKPDAPEQYGVVNATIRVALTSVTGGVRRHVITKIVSGFQNNSWVTVALPSDQHGEFELTLACEEGAVQWFSTGQDSNTSGSPTGSPTDALCYMTALGNGVPSGHDSEGGGLFTARDRFDHISVPNSAPGGSQFSVRLERAIGDHWREVEVQNFLGAQSWVSLNFDPKAQGRYRLTRSVSGGRFVPIDLQSARITRTSYSVTIPEIGVTATIPDGDAYRIPAVTSELILPDKLVAGSDNTITVNVANFGSQRLSNVIPKLTLPSGWDTVSDRTESGSGLALAAHGATSLEWTVSGSRSDKALEAAAVELQTTYEFNGQAKGTLETRKTAYIENPVDDQFQTFSSAPTAYFGQSGIDIAIAADGRDIQQTVADEYASVYREGRFSDGSVATVLVRSQQDTDPWAKAGIIVRNKITAAGESLGYIAAMITPSHGPLVQWDNDGDGYVDSTGGSGASNGGAPTWLRLTRKGQAFIAESSSDAVIWHAIGSQINVAGAAETQDVGIFMTAHSTSTVGLVEFEQFTIE